MISRQTPANLWDGDDCIYRVSSGGRQYGHIVAKIHILYTYQGCQILKVGMTSTLTVSKFEEKCCVQIRSQNTCTYIVVILSMRLQVNWSHAIYIMCAYGIKSIASSLDSSQACKFSVWEGLLKPVSLNGCSAPRTST
jgi:hypothetical protein